MFVSTPSWLTNISIGMAMHFILPALRMERSGEAGEGEEDTKKERVDTIS
jgi:hypothetical protein